jgi:hypothetical protein
LRALIGGQAYERASSGNVIQCPPDERWKTCIFMNKVLLFERIDEKTERE